MHERNQPRDEDYGAWVGRTERCSDEVTAWPLLAYAATLDRNDPPPAPGDPLPPGAHWLYFLPTSRESELAPDGLPRRGGFLPPVTLPRRMWAGGRLFFHDMLLVGDRAERVSTIKDVSTRRGRTGQLCFVLVEHRISTTRGLAIREEHDIVFREAPARDAAPVAAPNAAPGEPLWQRSVVADDVFLFRYSALTFNAHRIHYDRRYATETEGYPGLIVHGPLQATLLLDLLRRERPDVQLREFAFRALAPLFETDPFTLNGRPAPDGSAELWTAGPGGAPAMSACARW
ncbi:MAG: MaoC family dehydratase N-terminal domain-containing protein [Vulcanimicrobiaceae bacterium]